MKRKLLRLLVLGATATAVATLIGARRRSNRILAQGAGSSVMEQRRRKS